jgi:hypothetical protein
MEAAVPLVSHSVSLWRHHRLRKLILGSKPLADMSESEMYAAIEELRSNREALRAEAIARHAKGEKIKKEPRAPREQKIDPFAADMLAFLKGDKDEI